MRSAIAAAATIIFFGCQGDPVSVERSAAQARPLTSVSPETYVVNQPFSSLAYNPCTAEWVQFDGAYTAVMHSTHIGDGWYQILSFGLVYAKGAGQTSGATYLVRNVSKENINAIWSTMSPYEDHLNQQATLVRVSDGISSVWRTVWQVTVPPDGDVAVLVEKSWIECP